MSGNDSAGVQRRYRFNAESLQDAIKESERVLGYSPPETGVSLTVDEVFARWLNSRNVSAKTARDYRNAIAAFIGWIEEKGEVPPFADLRMEQLQNYANHLQRKGYAPDSIRLYLYPLTAAARWAAANWPEEIRDIGVGLNRPHHVPTEYKADLSPALTFREACEFLEFLQGHPEGHKVLLAVAIQVLAGLRVTEVVRLTRDKLNRDLLTVEGIVKNRPSLRRIPLPAVVLDLAAAAPPGERFTIYSEMTSYSKAVAELMEQWEGRRVLTKNLRRTIPTEFRARGLHGWAMERYIGHAPTTVTDRHYVALHEGKQIELFRRQVVRPINRILRTFRAKLHKKSTLDNVVILRDARKCS